MTLRFLSTRLDHRMLLRHNLHSLYHADDGDDRATRTPQASTLLGLRATVTRRMRGKHDGACLLLWIFCAMDYG